MKESEDGCFHETVAGMQRALRMVSQSLKPYAVHAYVPPGGRIAFRARRSFVTVSNIKATGRLQCHESFSFFQSSQFGLDVA